MKVIIDNYSNKIVRSTCCGCKSVLEMSREDIKYDLDKDPYFVCPLCKKCTYLSLDSKKTLMV